MESSYIKLVLGKSDENNNDEYIDIWNITYNKELNVFICKNINEKVINMQNVENFINIWILDVFTRLGFRKYAYISLVLNGDNFYHCNIYSKHNIGKMGKLYLNEQDIKPQIINRIIGTLKDIEI